MKDRVVEWYVKILFEVWLFISKKVLFSIHVRLVSCSNI